MKQGFSSSILHSDRRLGSEHGAVHKPVHTSVMYGYEDARDIAAVFQGKQPGYSYGRQINPTVNVLETKISLMEDGLSTVAFATGMAAIASTLFSLLHEGDHVVASAFLFGNTNSLLASFARHGIQVSLVDATSATAVEAAITDRTRLVFVETIANPCTQVADLETIGTLCASKGLVYVVDNTMTCPYLFQPKRVGASLVVNSLTKYIGGHANALGGAVTETGHFDWSGFDNILPIYQKGEASAWGIQQIRKKGLRDFGASLAPEAAHHISVGSDTLALRMNQCSSNARAVADYLSTHSKVEAVYYPGLARHPQHDRAKSLFRDFGGMLSVELRADVDCFDFINRLNLVICSSHLGDNRSLAIPVAHTVFHEMGAERRVEMGIAESLIRLSIGIEDGDDLLADFEQALA